MISSQSVSAEKIKLQNATLTLKKKCTFQGRGKVFYVGGAVGGGGGGGGGGSQFLRINITPNRNRKSCYSLRTFMRSVRQQLAILQMGMATMNS